jgi:pSer/pThr/pTyr-binding forkhead associated (FHA) protein
VVIPLAPGKERWVLGRAPECDLPINDGSLSRSHLAFVFGPGQPTVEDLGSLNGSSLAGQRLQPGQPQPLVAGAQLQAGSVYLTFLDAAGLFERLRAR